MIAAAWRAGLLASCGLALSMTGIGRAQGLGRALGRSEVIARAQSQGPTVIVAATRVGEARALHVGAAVAATSNPELMLSAGPRWLNTGNSAVVTDVTATLAWPVDLSGARHARVASADAQTRLAELEAEQARRTAVFEALDLWLRALGADARVRLETERAALDAQLATIAQARRRAGTVGDGEVALGEILRAEGQARLRAAEGERAALLAELAGRLGLSGIAVSVVGTLESSPPAALEVLLAGLARRVDLQRAQATLELAHRDLALARRLGAPVPRVSVLGGRENEYFVHAGVDLPLPIYQRNQTQVAVGGARVVTQRVLATALAQQAAAELRAAYAQYQGARAAAAALAGANAALDDAEHLSARAYELGQRDLSALVATRRETTTVRAAALDARIALARARLRVDAAAGSAP